MQSAAPPQTPPAPPVRGFALRLAITLLTLAAIAGNLFTA